jgi:uncharacterized protein YegJ (DUF2314 family)
MRLLLRLLQIVCGLLLGFGAFFCAVSGLVFLSYDKNLVLQGLICLVFLGIAYLGFRTSFRLLLGRPARDTSPRALRIASYVFLLLPIAGLFTGHYLRHPIAGVLQALVFIGAFFQIRQSASRRESVFEIDPADPLIVASVERARASLPLLRELWDKREGELYVKFPFHTDGGQTEHVWGELLAIEGDEFRANIGNEPVTHDGDLPEFVSLPLREIEDWMLPLEDGSVRGGFRTQAEIAYCRARQQPVPAHMTQMRFIDA